MADVIIKDMEMPENCEDCRKIFGCYEIGEDGTVWCLVAKGYIGDERTICPLRPAPEWIPCSERLPEKSGQYYVSGGDKVWVCKFLIIPTFTGGWCNDASNPVVQAWMPLPEPPKGGDAT